MTASLNERDRKSFLDLLELAEKVQGEKEQAQRQFYLALFGVMFGVVGVLAVLLTYFEQFSLSAIAGSPVGVFGIVIALAGYFFGSYLTSQSMRKIRRERKAYEEVMGLVQEVYQATKSDLSAVETAEVKIRFSRLDI